MSVEANKVIVRRMFEEIFNQGTLALVDTWVAATFVNHAAPAEMLSGPESLKGHVVLLRTAFPDLHFTVEELIADEEHVAARVTLGGTHRGVFRDSPSLTSHLYSHRCIWSTLLRGRSKKTGP
jgi:hypothetical protein